MAKFNAERESGIVKAISFFQNTLGIKKSVAATKFHIPYPCSLLNFHPT